MHGLAVFGDGAARDIDALHEQHLDNAVVRQHVGGFHIDERADALSLIHIYGDAAISPAPVAPGALPAAAAVGGEEPVEGEEGAVKGKDDEEEEEVIEDASELGEDEDDMAEVIEKVEDDDERG